MRTKSSAWREALGALAFAASAVTAAAAEREPISALPFTITQGGSYYAPANLAGTGGITVLTNNVTIDLNGFALAGLNSTNSGIFAPFAFTNLVVSNGSIRGWNGHGIYAETISNCEISRVEITSNAFSGLNIGNHGRVTDCKVRNNGTSGILTGTHASVKDCLAESNRSDGIHTGGRSEVIDCTAQGNRGNGITIGGASTVKDSTAAQNGGSGIYVNQPSCTITGNTCHSNNPVGFQSNAGIYIFDNSNHIESNRVTANGYAGICVFPTCTSNVIASNTVSDNSPNNYLVPAGNELRPVGNEASSSNSLSNSAR